MVQSPALFNIKNSKLSLNLLGDVYQQFNQIYNTTISLQYNRDKFLSFKIYEASHGVILRQKLNDKDEETALQCMIRGAIYTLNRDHLDQLSNRERRELFNHLGINQTKAEDRG